MHDLERMNMIRTTDTPHHPEHGVDDFLDFGLGQTKVRQGQSRGMQRFRLVRGGFVGRGLRRIAHAQLGYKASGIAKKTFVKMIFPVTLVLGLGLPARPARAHDAPAIAPTRLEFDATQAPKNCNDQPAFKSILANWVPHEVLSAEANRRLTVRIRRSPTGGKLADLTLTDETGAQLGRDHKSFAGKTECYKVLYETAQEAANLLGAFEKPPAPEPVTCPVCPAPPASVEPARALSPSAPPLPIAPILPALPKAWIAPRPDRRAFIGAGVFLGTGIMPDAVLGPHFSLGFVPSPHSPRIQVELDGAWTMQNLRLTNAPGSMPVHVIPIFGSLCYSRYVLRICSGLATTFYQAKRQDLGPGQDELRMALAGFLRMGTEFEIAAPFSIRLDAFAQVRFWQRTFGEELARLDTLNPVAFGAAAMGVWSWE